MSEFKNRTIIVSDVSTRDGIGIEVYRDDKLVVEIFRDDSDKTRMIKIFNDSISLEFMEECIQIFKKEIPWDFIKDQA